VEKVAPELQRLREACKATTSADQVKNECVSAQARLDALLVDATGATVDRSTRTDMRQQFLNCADLGPNRQGLLRVLHELNNAPHGTTGKGADVRARQLRVPLCNDSPNQALLLWRAFLRCALPENLPLLLISRGSVDWIDVVIGEPLSDDLFCLQASAKALP